MLLGLDPACWSPCSLFDYYGEPPVGGLEVSSTYGQYDLCGFPKAAAFWYRTQWLLSIPDGPDKTFPTKQSHEVHLVESWESPDSFPSSHGNKYPSPHTNRHTTTTDTHRRHRHRHRCYFTPT